MTLPSAVGIVEGSVIGRGQLIIERGKLLMVGITVPASIVVVVLMVSVSTIRVVFVGNALGNKLILVCNEARRVVYESLDAFGCSSWELVECDQRLRASFAMCNDGDLFARVIRLSSLENLIN